MLLLVGVIGALLTYKYYDLHRNPGITAVAFDDDSLHMTGTSPSSHPLSPSRSIPHHSLYESEDDIGFDAVSDDEHHGKSERENMGRRLLDQGRDLLQTVSDKVTTVGTRGQRRTRKGSSTSQGTTMEYEMVSGSDNSTHELGVNRPMFTIADEDEDGDVEDNSHNVGANDDDDDDEVQVNFYNPMNKKR